MLSRVLKADALDRTLCDEAVGLFSRVLSGCQGACELSFGVCVLLGCVVLIPAVVVKHECLFDGVSACVCFLPGRSTSPANYLVHA